MTWLRLYQQHQWVHVGLEVLNFAIQCGSKCKTVQKRFLAICIKSKAKASKVLGLNEVGGNESEEIETFNLNIVIFNFWVQKILQSTSKAFLKIEIIVWNDIFFNGFNQLTRFLWLLTGKRVSKAFKSPFILAKAFEIEKSDGLSRPR